MNPLTDLTKELDETTEIFLAWLNNSKCCGLDFKLKV